MAIFPNIETDSVVQVNDKFRISAEKTFQSQDETQITDVEIEPEAGAGFISGMDTNPKNWILDWEYSTDGTKVITLRITNGGGSQSKTASIVVLTEANDKLFSDDNDLVEWESDIKRYVPKGRNTFKYVHREAQTQILEYLYRIGVVSSTGVRLTKDSIIDIEEVRQWSKFKVLKIIFNDVSTVVGDKFEQLSSRYMGYAQEAGHKAILKLDLNGDGNADSTENVDLTWRRLDRA